MTYFRKNKRESKINPEVEAFLTNTGPALYKEFLQSCIRGKKSMRGRNYDTQPDHTWHSAEQRTNRMEDRV